MHVSDGRALTPEGLLDVIVADDVLVLRGELCFWTSELLRKLLRRHPGLGLATIDASGLTFVDIAGARALAELAAHTGCGRVLPGRCMRHLDEIVPLGRIAPVGLHLDGA